MNFPTSTHKRDWLFDSDTLQRKYAEAQQAALLSLAGHKAAAAAAAAADEGTEAAAPDAKKQRADSPISLDDQAALRLYYQVKLKAIVAAQQLPSKVLNASLMFFKRFYTGASCLEHDPLRVMPTCIYLGCKVEEAYRSADSLCKQLGIDPGLVLRFEVPLLQGLKFDLVVHSPYRALAGLFQELDALRSQQSAALDPQLLGAPSEALGAAHAKARSALDLLQLSDAPLLHPPGVLAVAALRSGFRGVQLPCQRYLQHVAACGAAAAAAGGIGEAAGAPAEQQQQQQPAPVPDAVVQAHHEQLLATLAALDGLAAGLQGQLDEGALQARATGVDRAIKLWKKELGGGGAGGAAGNATAAAGSDGAGGAGQGQGVVPSQQQQQAVAAG